jgi:hypothetical protein
MYLTDQAVERVARDLQRTSSWKENALKKAKAREHEIRALLGVATGTLLFSFGDGAYAQAGKSEFEFWGLPVSAMAGIGLHALGLSGYAKGLTKDAHNVGTGALAVWLTAIGRKMGEKMRGGAHHGVAGQFGTGGYGPGALPAPQQRYVVDAASMGVPAYGG